jgi:hypothetical protein
MLSGGGDQKRFESSANSASHDRGRRNGNYNDNHNGRGRYNDNYNGRGNDNYRDNYNNNYRGNYNDNHRGNYNDNYNNRGNYNDNHNNHDNYNGHPRGRDGGGGGRRPPQGGRGRGRGRGQGPPPRYNDNIVCQICKKDGHAASTCWWRYEESNNNNNGGGEREVNAAYGVDTNWYGDSGATDHITGNLEKLMIRDQYHGKDKIHTTNGEGMHISHIGHTSIQTPNCDLHLKNILHVPSATKNLVSIHKLTLDNDIFLEFHPWYFLIKDRATENILLKGRCEGGLYPIVSSSSSPSKQVCVITKPSTSR